MSNPDNKGLLEPIEAIYPLVKKFHDSYSRADIWALATLVSADLSLIGDDRPDDISFSMRFIGREDCSGADAKGVGGPEVEMPSNDLNTHELLEFFSDEFDFDADETVVRILLDVYDVFLFGVQYVVVMLSTRCDTIDDVPHHFLTGIFCTPLIQQ